MRLPDISYGGEPRPLAKQDPGIAMKKAQVEIDLSKAQLGADLYVSGAIGQANIKMAREAREVDKDKAWSQAKIASDAFGHKIDMEGADRSAKMQLAGTLAQTAILTAAKWFEADQESKAANGSAQYSKNMAMVTADLTTSPTIDLNKYPDVDFSQIPEHMIYEGVDEVTGQKVRTAPNHLAAPLVYADVEPKIREASSKGIDSRLAQAKFNNAVSVDSERHTLAIISSKAKHEHEFLQGQYESAINTRVESADLPGAVSTIDSAEARGVFSAEEAAKKRKTIVADVAFSNRIQAVDKAASLADLAQIKESLSGLPKEAQLPIRSAISQKENDFERIIEKKRVENERAMVGLHTVRASDVAIAGGGLKDYEAGRQAIIKEYAKADPAHLDDYLRAWDSRFSGIQSHIKQQKEQVQAAWYRDPAKPIPAEFDGKDLVEAKRYQAKALSGEPIETNTKTYIALQRMAADAPAEFSQVNLDTLRGHLTDSDMKHFGELQAKVVSGKSEHTNIVSAQAQFDDSAKQAFGAGYEKDEKKLAKVNGMLQAYSSRIEQIEQETGKKTTATERQAVINDLFMTTVKGTAVKRSGWLPGKTTTGTLTMKDDEITKYTPAITAILRNQGVPVTSSNIMKEYSIRLKLGKLEELEL